MRRDYYAAVLGTPEDLVLIPMPVEPENSLVAYAVEKSLRYCGMMAFVNGKCHARCAPGLDAFSTMKSAVPHFAEYLRTQFGETASLTPCPIQGWMN